MLTIKQKTSSYSHTKKTPKESFLFKDISITKKGFSNKKKEKFYSELHILLSAGVDIKSVLDLIEKQEKEENIKKKIILLKEYIIGGSSLSDAMERINDFTIYEYHSVRIGEESGKLPEIIKELGGYFNKKIKLSRQIVSAISYPLLVCSFAFVTVVFLLKFVVPMFSDVFKRFHSDLPVLTKMVINISNHSQVLIYIFLLMGAVAIALYSQRKKEWFRKWSSDMILRIPVLGNIIRKIYLSRFCLSMNLLLSAKTPLLKSLALVKKMVSFYPIEKSIEEVEKEILQGAFLYESLSKYPIYEARLITLLKVGEEVNKLDFIFSRLSQQYSEEVDHQTATLNSLIEPLMIIFLGIVVSVILVSMYLPLFQLSSSIR